MSPPVEHTAEPAWTSPNVPSTRQRSSSNTLSVIGIGIAVGIFALTLAALDLRWIVLFLVTSTFGFVIVMVRDRERLLTATFLLSMQLDVYVRLLYGRAGTPGFEIPLSVCAGTALWLQMRTTEDSRGAFVWFGDLERPIKALLGTTAVALLFTNERFAGVGRLLFELQLFFVYALAMNIVRRENDVWKAMGLMAFTLGLQSVICMLQSRLGITFSVLGEVTNLGDVPRPGGTVSTNPAGFASFIMPLLMVVSSRFMSRDRDYRGRADGLLALLGVTAIILTFTRAAWVGMAIGFAYITVVGYRRRYITTKNLLVIGVALAVIGAIAFPMMQARLASEPVGDSYNERANLNRIAVGIILHHPLFGLGPGAYDQQFKEYLEPGAADENWIAGVHNEYLMRAAETGIAGGLALVWVLLAGLSQARRLSRSQDPAIRIFALGWAAGLLALAWQMYWVPWRGFSYNSILWLFLGLTEGLDHVARRRESAMGAATIEPQPQPIA